MATLALRRRSPILVALLVASSALAVVVVEQRPAEAAVTAVKGYACGYYTNVGLFGGPQAKLGCAPQLGQPFAPATASSLSPSVSLPPSGSASPITATDPDGAAAKYGPAVIFGGVWPDHVAAAPPSGPITVSTQGTTGAGGSVTSSTDITLRTPANPDSPGGFGPNPVWGDALHVECSASETAVSGSTTFTNSFIAKSTDSDGNPREIETIPTNPPPNYTRHGVITNVGDVFTAVFNEQIVNPDGSLTVNAVHMYLFGPVAVGDMVKGQVTCGTTPGPAVPADTRPPTCGVPVVAPVSAEDPTPKVPREELVGVFDTGGIQSVTNIQATNGTVRVGMAPNDDADPNNDYLKFTPGQKGPLTLVAVRTNESLPMAWSFDVTDAAGNTAHCTGVIGHEEPHRAVGDYDGDGKTDVGVYRPSNAIWFVQRSGGGNTILNWGSANDVPTVGDFDGDGKADITVFRPSNGLWFIQNSGNGTATIINWGASGDIPVPGDYDGDGKDDVAVYRPNGNLWFIRNSSNGTATIVNWGSADDIPVVGDFDGDGKDDIAVFRPSSGLWFIRNSSNGTATIVNWGASGDIPKVGDFDGDGKDDIAVYRPSNQLWFIRNSSTGAATIINWGSSGDIPVVGDYDADGRSDIAVFRPSTGFFFINRSTAGLLVVNWGASGDIPVGQPPLSGP